MYERVFYATVRCRLRHYTKLPWREIKNRDTETKNGLQALKKAKQRKEARTKGSKPINDEKRHKEQKRIIISQIQASSDGNTHKSKQSRQGIQAQLHPSSQQASQTMPARPQQMLDKLLQHRNHQASKPLYPGQQNLSNTPRPLRPPKPPGQRNLWKIPQANKAS